MSVHGGGLATLEYYPCRYGNSRVQFRGPKRSLEGRFIAFLGSTETYGRFIEAPFPHLLEQRLGVVCVNFGVVNAGVDLYLNDPSVLDSVMQARAKVVQVMGAQNMSNRYYAVHPRRNDRFLRASERLEELYPEVDFTEFHFVRHMLGKLLEVSPERFANVVDELRQAWIARMKNILTQIRGKVILLWFSECPVPEEDVFDLGHDPLFVTRDMIDTLRPRVSDVVVQVASDMARLEGTMGMVYSDLESCAAAELQGPLAHAEAANRLEPLLQKMI
ncbi:DUF6473 family protein [Sagittula salina]|uniref:DUF6473 domain-containing protein n=1 Tax=Sagittula salina TaxID=2820268 RepID=A0A940MRF5_9RHOB|nr:DUF6473 family protein [Sagittula salina]MBP0483436.1 hypothetical protein [Sagittula salina]